MALGSPLIPTVSHAALISASVFTEDASGQAGIAPGLVSSATVTSANGSSTASASVDLAAGALRAFAHAQEPYQFSEDTFCDGVPCRIPLTGGLASANVRLLLLRLLGQRADR